MTEWMQEERALYDAQADHEAWSYAHEILEPWVRITRSIGSDELERVMEKALAEVEEEVGRARDVVESLGGAVGRSSAPLRRSPELFPTVFGNVLLELVESRNPEITPSGIRELARKAGLDDQKLIDRMRDKDVGFVGYLDGLARELDLTDEEKLELSHAYTFERRRGEHPSPSARMR